MVDLFQLDNLLRRGAIMKMQNSNDCPIEYFNCPFNYELKLRSFQNENTGDLFIAAVEAKIMRYPANIENVRKLTFLGSKCFSGRHYLALREIARDFDGARRRLSAGDPIIKDADLLKDNLIQMLKDVGKKLLQNPIK